MQKITFTDGQKLRSATYTYKDGVTILHDFTETQSINNWTTTGYNQHGSTYIKSLMNEREVTLSFWLIGKDMADFYSKRDEMYKLYNPMYGMGYLRYQNDIVDRTLDVYISKMPREVENYGNGRRYEVVLMAAYPFYRDTKLNTFRFVNGIGGFTFEAVFDDFKIFGLNQKSAVITNKGDIPAPITLTINGAEMVNPRLMLNGGDFIGITKSITAKDKIKITTGYGNKAVTINNKAADKYLMDGSSWLQLPVGESNIVCVPDAGDPDVTISWYNYYLGV